MLKELAVRNLAIVEHAELSLTSGLTCLTGETGAGKSILVDAISLLLGGKAGPEYLREGRDAVIEAAFDVSRLPEIKEKLSAQGIEPGDEVIIRRVLSPGRSKAYVNGSLVPVSALQDVGELLVDLHGQHEHQSLLRVDAHAGLLDAYCQLDGKAAECADAYRSLFEQRKRLEELRGQGRESAKRQDLLRYQRDEIDQAGLDPSEEESLGMERGRLLHADRLKALSEAAVEGLKDSEASALALVGAAGKAAQDISSLLGGWEECGRFLESASVSITEACAMLRELSASLDADPERLSEVEARLDLIGRLKKKYGETVAEILRYGDEVDKELSSIEDIDGEAASIEAGIKASESRLAEVAGLLSAGRRKGACALSKKIEAELAGLGMQKAKFQAALTPLPEPGPRGAEKVEFLFSANPGEPPRPLSKIASGGELSRVMLAVKVILADADRVPTLIFDEVDTGVGGNTAVALGKKLREAAAGRQVLCITHLPQVASFAGEQFMVEKSVAGGQTAVSVRKLGKDERVREIARMLGGEGSKAASAHAEELVKQGELYG